ncbi:2-oxo acid dehydrogenase subunit E2 [Polaribacter sp.]|nr:2-oxo acid dehydrogenase subunit E2 [Polaribacter sp.]
MAEFQLKLPKMGESVAEATITSWLKNVGDSVEVDDVVVEIATDKVDSEVPVEVEGTIKKILFEEGDVVQVGQTMAIIETDASIATFNAASTKEDTALEEIAIPEEVEAIEKSIEKVSEIKIAPKKSNQDTNTFYSPLVRNIAETEGISNEELESISGSGKDGRITKEDVLSYLENRSNLKKEEVVQTKPAKPASKPTQIATSKDDEVIELSRMGKLIAGHMQKSLQTSAHVQSFIEIDVTNIVKWRNKVKDAFLKREGEKLTFTPIFMQAIASTIKKHPLINISISGTTVVKKKAINLGMAAALADGNLIVPVIKNADQLNLVGMTKAVNDLSQRAKNNKLQPDEIKGGTYTVSNVGAFGTLFGTPIINQPEVAILALGAIQKVPAVIETPSGDFIGIRHKMFVSHSYDHRVVNGALGGMFIKTLKEILESWDIHQEF